MMVIIWRQHGTRDGGDEIGRRISQRSLEGRRSKQQAVSGAVHRLQTSRRAVDTHGGELATKLLYFGVKSTKVRLGADGNQTY